MWIVNTYLWQKQLTSTSLEHNKSELATAKQLDTVEKKKKYEPTKSKKKTIKEKGSPQGETSDKLGNCVELVGLAELVELVVPVAVPVVVGVLPLVTDDVLDADVESLAVDDAPCEHTIDTKSWRMRNKGIGRCRTFIVLVEGQAGIKRQLNRKRLTVRSSSSSSIRISYSISSISITNALDKPTSRFI